MIRPAEDDSADSGLISSQDVAYTELARMVNRLQQNILDATPKYERRLRTNEYERARVESNVRYACSVLKKLEEDAAAMAASARRQRLQEGLRARRETIEEILDRLQDLRHMALDDDNDGDDDVESCTAGEDLLVIIREAEKEASDSTKPASGDAPERQQPQSQQRAEDETPEALRPEPMPRCEPRTEPAAVTGHDSSDPTQMNQTLRARSSYAPSEPVSHSALRAALFASRRPAAAQMSTATDEALLDQQRAEQDALSDSILRMARALKTSSHSFASALDADKLILGAAGDGIDKTEKGMDTTRGRMGALRRMTEGRGWWGRMMLFAWVYGLMLALMLLVFVLPKLRL